ncbi:hypothetical protein BP6252_13092 [Coleophoma cylindrospora]|uniref:N-acetyltransferase domain-containing protein n=1 Tax=Coleophoma cylindrospora TaxID=1849047 RepID=A0A3D8Q9W3_9HELO|nr:hypothetical protein BP6252_13092 [Coleophoma cylindrospora]
MSFSLRAATEQDIPGMIDVWFKSFNTPDFLCVFPDSLTTRNWIAESMSRDFKYTSRNTFYMVIANDAKEPAIVTFSKWTVHPGGGPVPGWQERWVKELAEDMDIEIVSGEFFEPMERQHTATMQDRPHYYLEIVATNEDYQKLGLGSQILRWGCDAADAVGYECYLDSAANAKSLYEKFGYVVVEAAADPKGSLVPMLRPAKEARIAGSS